MSKDKLQLLSPLFLKYQADFEKNPRSRVFAPLAETYRKLGMIDKAMDILSQGIRFHPTYLMGYLGLAFCYFDLKQFNLAYSTLRPLVESNRDNIRLQKLFSEVCLELGKKEEALETLKYLLFINPRDKEIAELVLRVEKEVDEKYKPHHKPIIIPEKELSGGSEYADDSAFFDLDKLNNAKKAENDFDDWMTVDLGHEGKTGNKSISSSQSKVTNYDHWNVKKGDETHNLSDETKNEESRSYHVHLDLEVDSDPALEAALKETFKESLISLAPEKEIQYKKQQTKMNDGTPLVTHTLVDLYCGQGHIEKALEVLEKILLLNPNDQKTIKKIKEIQALIQPLEQYDEVKSHSSANLTLHSQESAPIPAKVIVPGPDSAQNSPHLIELTNLKDISEEDGRRHLMSLFDEKLGPIEIEEDNSKLKTARLVEEKLSLFLKKIQKRALDYQGSV
jgi:tetratricopeptide (TPR) repeat protein